MHENTNNDSWRSGDTRGLTCTQPRMELVEAHLYRRVSYLAVPMVVAAQKNENVGVWSTRWGYCRMHREVLTEGLINMVDPVRCIVLPWQIKQRCIIRRIIARGGL